MRGRSAETLESGFVTLTCGRPPHPQPFSCAQRSRSVPSHPPVRRVERSEGRSSGDESSMPATLPSRQPSPRRRKLLRDPPRGRVTQNRTISLTESDVNPSSTTWRGVPGLASAKRGFSLIELVVVLVLMAVIASLATLSLRGVIARQRLGRAIEVIEQFDTALRRSARDQRRQVAGVIDRGRGRLTVDPSGDPSRTYTLPRQVSIDAIRFGPVSSSRTGSQIIANADGSSPSYALRLASGDTRRWIFLVGGSGQVVDDFNDMAVDLALGMR